jgi:hypothetical protein
MSNWLVPVLENFQWQAPVISLTNTPGTTTKGFRYLIGTSPTGDWSTKPNNIAYYSGTEWLFVAPSEGMMVYITSEDTFYIYTSSWGIFAVASSGASQSVDKELDQTSHGFVIGDTVRFNGTIYVKAQANNGTNANNVLGLISNVKNADTFTIRSIGWLGGLSGLIPGSTYFLSSTIAGALTSTEPTSSGTISKPMLIAVSATSGFIFNFRNVPGTVFSLLVRDTGGDLKPIDEYYGQIGLLELNEDDDLTPNTENLNDTLLELDENNDIMLKV